MTKLYEALLFDLDGTLTDSKEGIVNSVQYVLSKYGIIEERQETLNSFIGPPLYESFQKYYSFDEVEAKRSVSYYREYYKERGIYENKVYPKIPELLSELKKQGYELIVATAKPSVFAKRVLNYFELHHYFSEIIGSELDGIRSSKADVIDYILSKLVIKPKPYVAMIEDREHDIIGARENGIDSIGVTYGYGTLEEIRAAEPRYIVQSVDELGELLLPTR